MSDEDTANMETTECLTPPCSSESKSDEVQSKEIGNSHAQFLKSSKFAWMQYSIYQCISEESACSHKNLH